MDARVLQTEHNPTHQQESLCLLRQTVRASARCQEEVRGSQCGLRTNGACRCLFFESFGAGVVGYRGAPPPA